MFDKATEEHAPLAEYARRAILERAPFKRADTILNGQNQSLLRPRRKSRVWQGGLPIASTPRPE
jgi:hypothetical protein